MPVSLDAAGASEALQLLATEADGYFDRAIDHIGDADDISVEWGVEDPGHLQRLYWDRLSTDLAVDARRLAARTVELGGWLAGASRNAPLASEADQRNVTAATKSMRASLLLRHFRSWSTQVINDEDRVLGVTPAGQSDELPCPPGTAKGVFGRGVSELRAVLDLVAASGTLGGTAAGDATPPSSARCAARLLAVAARLTTAT
jgi:hypothetical protein